MNVNPMGNQAWGPNPPTMSQIIADLRRRVLELESRRQFYKITFDPGALAIAPQETGEITLTFSGVRVGDAVEIAYPPSNPELDVTTVVTANDTVFITVYNPSAVVTANLTGTWSAFRFA
jgi:hypothetical protein